MRFADVRVLALAIVECGTTTFRYGACPEALAVGGQRTTSFGCHTGALLGTTTAVLRARCGRCTIRVVRDDTLSVLRRTSSFFVATDAELALSSCRHDTATLDRLTLRSGPTAVGPPTVSIESSTTHPPIQRYACDPCVLVHTRSQQPNVARRRRDQTTCSAHSTLIAQTAIDFSAGGTN